MRSDGCNQSIESTYLRLGRSGSETAGSNKHGRYNHGLSAGWQATQATIFILEHICTYEVGSCILVEAKLYKLPILLCIHDCKDGIRCTECYPATQNILLSSPRGQYLSASGLCYAGSWLFPSLYLLLTPPHWQIGEGEQAAFAYQIG